MITLEPRLLDMVRAILSSHVPDARVLAFGSRVKGKAHRFSDLDLAVDRGKALTFRELAMLRDAFSSSYLPIKVDVLDLNAISPEFRSIVLRDGEQLT